MVIPRQILEMIPKTITSFRSLITSLLSQKNYLLHFMIIELLGSNLNRLGSLWRLNKTVVFILTFLESISQDKIQNYKWIF
jgi:hypothetical protein